jgi:hypothetical protein
MNHVKQTSDSVFYKALSLADPAERRAFLDHACKGDATLRAMVEKKYPSRTRPKFFSQKAGRRFAC